MTLSLFLLPMPALAQGAWSPPEGCEIYMTTQSKGCRVSNHYICAADPDGDQWRADFDQEGVYFYSRINSEAEWIESFDGNPVVRQSLDPNPEDPASFSDLIGSGVDSYAFSLSREDGMDSQVYGYDRLTGRTVTIDGQQLEETEFDYTETDVMGNVLRRARGNEYISRDKRVFFAGPGETDLGDGQWLPIDGSPVDFAFPGDKGFGSTRPIYDCDAILSLAPPALKGSDHDQL